MPDDDDQEQEQEQEQETIESTSPATESRSTFSSNLAGYIIAALILLLLLPVLPFIVLWWLFDRLGQRRSRAGVGSAANGG